MPLNDRQNAILTALKSADQVEVEALSRQLGVTTQTVRRDLSDLCDRGLVLRMHGGARRALSTTVRAYEERRLNNITDKQSVANAAARLIPDGASVAINIGTTTERVAEALRLHKDLMVVSNNINIIHILRDTRLKSLIMIGGEVRLSDGAIVGEDAVQAIGNYKVDYAIVGTSALDFDGSVLDFDKREVAVAKAILANARQKILVADTSKFQVSAPYRICNIGELDHVILGSSPPPEFLTIAERTNTNIIIAGGSNEHAN